MTGGTTYATLIREASRVDLEAIALCAFNVAAAAPKKQGKYVMSATVYWPRVWDLRAAFEKITGGQGPWKK